MKKPSQNDASQVSSPKPSTTAERKERLALDTDLRAGLSCGRGDSGHIRGTIYYF